MENFVTIRQANQADALHVATVHVHSWQAAYKHILSDELLAGLSIPQREAMWIRALESPSVDLMVAVDSGDQIVGFVAASRARDGDAPPERGEISAIYTVSAVWGTGVGYLLMQAALDKLRKRTFTEASLWVLEQNVRGIRFYERFGFVKDEGANGVKLEQIGNTTVREQRYIFRLRPTSDE